MYIVGDKVIYGSSGACVVTEICTPDFSREERGRKYYKLRPVYGSEIIYAPVDAKTFMRPVMTKAEAECFVTRIPDIHGESFHSCSVTALRQKYEEFFREHDCESYVRLIKSINKKSNNGKKLGQTDLRYLKRAEDTLHNELAVALEIEPSQVPAYIQSALKNT